MALTSLQLLHAYAQGIFPMAVDGSILWFDPDPRAILPLEAFHVPRRLGRTLRHAPFELRVNCAFAAVIQACARADLDDDERWINADIIAAYTRLHRQGFAHSVEAWRQGELVGGLYGVALRGLFAGESMFSMVRDASKVALVHLVGLLRQGGFALLDVQFMTAHLRQFGAIEISRGRYRQRLAAALQAEARFPNPNGTQVEGEHHGETTS